MKLALVVLGLIAIAGLADWNLPHTCRWCGREYANRPALHRHIKHYHND